MAYADQSLVRIGQSAPLAVGTTEARTAHLYVTNDAAAVVEAAGYFNGARPRLVKGDVIFSSMVLGGTPVLKGYVVTAVPAAPSNITIALASSTAG